MAGEGIFTLRAPGASASAQESSKGTITKHVISITARNLLRPLSGLPLRFGKIDLAPLFALALLGLLAWWAPVGLEWLYRKFGA